MLSAHQSCETANRAKQLVGSCAGRSSDSFIGTDFFSEHFGTPKTRGAFLERPRKIVYCNLQVFTPCFIEATQQRCDQITTMNQTDGPQWANPETARPDAVIQEEEFFAPLSTLDEPVIETIMRDVRAVGSKLKVVMLPMERNVSFFQRKSRQHHDIVRLY